MIKEEYVFGPIGAFILLACEMQGGDGDVMLINEDYAAFAAAFENYLLRIDDVTWQLNRTEDEILFYRENESICFRATPTTCFGTIIEGLWWREYEPRFDFTPIQV